MVSLLLALLYISKAISEVIEFDATGNKYIRVRIPADDVKTYQVSLERDEYLYMMGSSSVNYELIHLNTNITFESELDATSRPYYLLHSENTQLICSSYDYDHCTFNLIVTNLDSSSRSIWIRFNRNTVIKPKKTYSNIIKMRKRRRYGMKIREQDLPILVRLTPNQDHREMDIDLYGYSEKKFTSYYYPNRAERNHINNYMEQYLISSVDSYYVDGEWNFFEIYGSTDSSYDEMDYTFEVITNYQYRFVIHYDTNNMRLDEPDTLLKKILLIFAFTIATSFILGIVISFFCTFRHQILFCLRIRSTPHRHGASKKEIKKLKVIHYKPNEIEAMESTQCVICLEDYCENDKIRILKCNHNFHVHCSDEWLYINNKCPLCYQNIVEAKDVHNQEDIELVRLQNNELQQLQSDTTSSVNHDQSVSIDPQPTNC